MKRLLTTFTLTFSVLIGQSFAAWAPSAGGTFGNRGKLTVQAVQYTPSSSGTVFVYVYFSEHNNVRFEFPFPATSTTELQQANAILSLLLTAKTTGLKVSLDVPTVSSGAQMGIGPYTGGVIQLEE